MKWGKFRGSARNSATLGKLWAVGMTHIQDYNLCNSLRSVRKQ